MPSYVSAIKKNNLIFIQNRTSLSENLLSCIYFPRLIAQTFCEILVPLQGHLADSRLCNVDCLWSETLFGPLLLCWTSLGTLLGSFGFVLLFLERLGPPFCDWFELLFGPLLRSAQWAWYWNYYEFTYICIYIIYHNCTWFILSISLLH